jgi:mono/diheme cytochrome c family protein
MLRTVVLGFVVAVAAAGAARADEDEKVDFRRQILPIFDGACSDCHG